MTTRLGTTTKAPKALGPAFRKLLRLSRGSAGERWIAIRAAHLFGREVFIAAKEPDLWNSQNTARVSTAYASRCASNRGPAAVRNAGHAWMMLRQAVGVSRPDVYQDGDSWCRGWVDLLERFTEQALLEMPGSMLDPEARNDP